MHPDAEESTKIVRELPLDPDIKAVIGSMYVDANKLLLAQAIRNAKPTGKTSDGYHTFDELYEHRITLYIALCNIRHVYSGLNDNWRSEYHSDGTRMEGWFVLGIGKEPGEQITYHIPMSRWDECKFAETLDRAPAYDGHTSADVLDRLKQL